MSKNASGGGPGSFSSQHKDTNLMDDDNSFASADKFDEKSLSLTNRPIAINEIKEKLKKIG